MISRSFQYLFCAALAATACDDQVDNPEPMDSHAWGYEGEKGPDFWAQLDPSYEVCADGVRQSPIDITPRDGSDAPSLEPEYHATPLEIANNGHTIEVTHEAGSLLRVGDDSWQVAQFHFHAPSEHTIDGALAPMELHIVHKDAAGALAVLGVLIEEGEANSALAGVFEHLPTEESEPEVVDGFEVDLEEVLPDDLAAWRYDGSLTTPPCTEGVRWHVLEERIEVSSTQLDAYLAIFDNNARPVQPQNGREIE